MSNETASITTPVCASTLNSGTAVRIEQPVFDAGGVFSCNGTSSISRIVVGGGIGRVQIGSSFFWELRSKENSRASIGCTQFGCAIF